MKKSIRRKKLFLVTLLTILHCGFTEAQLIISQYYEGKGINKWIEITNIGNKTCNTAELKLKLSLWKNGNFNKPGSEPDASMDLQMMLYPGQSALIGNPANSNEITYLKKGSAFQQSAAVISFEGTEVIAITDANGHIIDVFDAGMMKAKDISYVRNREVSKPSAQFNPAEWISVDLKDVAKASPYDLGYLGFYRIQSCTCCSTPAAQPTSLVFNTVTSNSIAASFSASASADEYLVLMSNTSSITAAPADGSSYNVGSTLGNAVVISNNSSTSFSASALSSSTTYYFFVFAIKSTSCTAGGGPKYLVSNPLSGNQTTMAPPCTAPASQPTALVFGTTTINSIAGSFNASAADAYLVLMSSSSSLTALPADGSSYDIGSTLGNAVVISNNSSTSFNASSLNSSTTYYFFVFAIRNQACSGGPKYLVSNPLSGNQTTLSPVCTTPASQPTMLVFGTTTYNSIQASFTTTTASGYLVLMSSSSTLSSVPVDGSSYSAGNSIGNAVVISNGSGSTFNASSLNSNSTYYFFVFAYNNTACTGGPKYLTSNPLSGNQTTSSPPVAALNFYFGNLHSHSSYSDGNADNVAKTPADDYAFAKTALCMDYLGISEHNHTGAGMSLANWAPGKAQCAAASSSNFLALYGMEWGVISGGGHVVVYGIDSLLGWEPGQYQVYVPKNVYTSDSGLFAIINRHGNNAFGYCAHPNTTDYNNLTGIAYDANADNALVGTAVESGPAFSTDTTYTNPGTSMSYLNYYRSLLAKGYYAGPTIDHDNHNMTFGKTAKSRLVILAPSLTETNLLIAMRQRRFYASEDCGARITYSINSQSMGSIITEAGAPVISVSAITSSPVSSIKVMYGVPGSGSSAQQLTSTNSSTLSYTDNALGNLSTRYYYLDITELNGDRIITAPIWYTRNNALVRQGSVNSFFVINDSSSATIKWSTEDRKAAGNSFLLEKSTDEGKTYSRIATLKGRYSAGITQNYSVKDTAVLNRVVYYRLSELDASGRIIFADIKIFNGANSKEPYLSVMPDNSSEIATLRIHSSGYESSVLEIYDISGAKKLQKQVNTVPGEMTLSMDISKLMKGSYIIRMRLGNKVMSHLFNKL
jgi:hypothetical protein